MAKRGWIYKEKDIHREWLKKNRARRNRERMVSSYFQEKLKIVKEFLDKECRGKRILDVGCGEGVLVEEYRKKGYDIEGVDSNYESDFVKIGDVTNLEYEDNLFDVILLLDVLEHIPYDKQYIALKEIKRVLKKVVCF
jgi:2-polyprenyl-3-methyl-5-hydroxy-6-metoxy-1,4-benzoquinol methylase